MGDLLVKERFGESEIPEPRARSVMNRELENLAADLHKRGEAIDH